MDMPSAKSMHIDLEKISVTTMRDNNLIVKHKRSKTLRKI